MSTFIVNLGPYHNGEAYAIVDYSTSYDPIANTTTVTFGQMICRTWADVGKTATLTITLTVTADDSGNKASASAYTEDHRASGGTDPQPGYGVTKPMPSPTSVVVKHSNTAGEKSVTISYSSITSWQTKSCVDELSVTAQSASTETGFKVYKLSIDAGEGSIIDVNRTSSAAEGKIGNLSNGADIYINDKLQITFDTELGYALKTCTVNDSIFTSGNTHTVNGNVAVLSIAELQGLVYINNGSDWDMYQVYIDNGSSWDQYIPYIDNGISWDICS